MRVFFIPVYLSLNRKWYSERKSEFCTSNLCKLNWIISALLHQFTGALFKVQVDVRNEKWWRLGELC